MYFQAKTYIAGLIIQLHTKPTYYQTTTAVVFLVTILYQYLADNTTFMCVPHATSDIPHRS